MKHWKNLSLNHLSDDEIASLTVKYLTHMTHMAPVFNEYIHAFVTEKPSDAFFFNREYLKEFNTKYGNARKEVPSHFYAMKI